MAELIDMTGKKINHLTVIEYAGTDGRKGALWKCQCDCGNIIKVRGSKLRNKTAKSCGCERNKKLIEYNQKNNFKDITGQRFGNLIALSPIKKPGDHHYFWKCQCDCGNIVEVLGSNLRRGNSTSCGCRIKSKGEEKINYFLSQNNIIFETQKTYDNCRFLDTNNLARFDFYLPNYNCLIEYDGRQHFEQGTGIYDNEEKFKLTQKRDQYKNQWCKENNIFLIRIPYTHYNFITLEDLLPETSKFLIK